jgi:hypothetical protein
VTTLHERLDLPNLETCFDQSFADAPMISVSDAQRRRHCHKRDGSALSIMASGRSVRAEFRSRGISRFSRAHRPRERPRDGDPPRQGCRIAAQDRREGGQG